MKFKDADAVYRDICNDLNQMTRIGIMVDGEWLWAKLNDALENAPTIEAVPVRKGEWVKNDNGTYSCSKCHSWIPKEQRHYAKYCLYCGADMRGERSE